MQVLYATVSDPAALFLRFREPLLRDYLIRNLTEAEAEARALRHIKFIIETNGALPQAWDAINQVPDGIYDEGDDNNATDELLPDLNMAPAAVNPNMLNAEQR